jgi:hypothetical protein
MADTAFENVEEANLLGIVRADEYRMAQWSLRPFGSAK